MTSMTCVDYERHEVFCAHTAVEPKVNWRTEDGCSGRVCQLCWQQFGMRAWPDLADHIGGPSAGLDLLDALRLRRP